MKRCAVAGIYRGHREPARRSAPAHTCAARVSSLAWAGTPVTVWLWACG